ncbi:C-3 sterol dehydrogenase/C-4-like protein [Xylariaceae sp. FL1019]|nr:C-3 sterol dehydrogenase/C-4-like protein [Xylariaceae sp. FL1019]
MPPTEQEKLDLGRVLVIGGCGFLGHHVVNLLLRDWKCSVSVIDLKCQRNRRPASDGIDYVEADITDADGLLKLFGRLRPDVVIHTASPPAQGAGAVSNQIFYKVNVEGTRAVIEACQANGVKALVYTSSASVISDNKSDLVNANEDYPVIRGKLQSEYYSETKAHAEQLVLEANRGESQLLTTAIRPSGIFGEGDMQLVYHAIKVYRQGSHKVQIGDNTNMFDFTYAENVAHAHLLAANALLVTASSKTAPLDHEKVDGEAFLVSNGSPVYFWDMMRAIWQEAGSPSGPNSAWILSRDLGLTLGFFGEMLGKISGKTPSLSRQRIVFSTMTRYYDISKARRRLGYEPLTTLADGVRRTVKWTLEQEQKA